MSDRFWWAVGILAVMVSILEFRRQYFRSFCVVIECDECGEIFSPTDPGEWRAAVMLHSEYECRR